MATIGISAALVGSLRFLDPPTSAFMLKRRLEARREGRQGFEVRQRWVPLADLPRHVGLAVISAEDQRFAAHDGFDFRALKGSFADYLAGARLRGASTITQQVAKNLFLWEGRSLVRKSIEAYLTVLIELAWPKRRILEVYLNIAEFGDGVFGIGAAASHHFGCAPGRLTPAQAALLAAILPDPLGRRVRDPSPRVRRKQRWILRQMPIVRALQPELSASR